MSHVMSHAAEDRLLVADGRTARREGPEQRLLFANEDWAVTREGLEHRGNGYFIARDEIAHRRSDGLWIWPVHMAEKLWCAPSLFAEAFMQAVRAYGLEPDAGLALAFHDAGRLQMATRYDRQTSTPALALHDAGRLPGEQAGGAAPAEGSGLPTAGRGRPEGARSVTARPRRPDRVARAGLTLLRWLRRRASGR